MEKMLDAYQYRLKEMKCLIDNALDEKKDM